MKDRQKRAIQGMSRSAFTKELKDGSVQQDL